MASRLKKFKNDNIEKIVSDFQKTDFYEDDFLKDLETGLKKSSENGFESSRFRYCPCIPAGIRFCQCVPWL